MSFTVSTMNTLDNISSKIFKSSSVWGAVIFGSMADGSFDSTSDIDIMVFAEHKLKYREYIDLYMSINQATTKDIDLVDYSTANDSLLRAVKNNYSVIYGDTTEIKCELNNKISNKPVQIKTKDEIINSTI